MVRNQKTGTRLWKVLYQKGKRPKVRNKVVDPELRNRRKRKTEETKNWFLGAVSWGVTCYGSASRIQGPLELAIEKRKTVKKKSFPPREMSLGRVKGLGKSQGKHAPRFLIC